MNRAVILEQPGPPEALVFGNWPMDGPLPPHHVRVALKAAGVNPIDTKLRQRGTFYPENGRAVLGCDGAGTVVEVGDRVAKVRVGDEVYFCQGGLGDTPGTYGEQAWVNERFLASKPQSLSFAAAAAAPLVCITAWEALFDQAELQSGQTVLIQAGAGGVGHVAVQLAKLRGARVCATVSTETNAQWVKSLGADHYILYPNTDVTTAVLDWTDGEGVDVAFDTVGGATLSQCFALTRYYGDVVTLLAPDATTDWAIARTRNLRVSFELMLTPMLKGLDSGRLHQAAILRQCGEWFDQGRLRIEVHKTFPLAAAADAHRYLERGSMVGKLVLLP
jgi:NADPH2:quinone reductase